LKKKHVQNDIKNENWKIEKNWLKNHKKVKYWIKIVKYVVFIEKQVIYRKR